MADNAAQPPAGLQQEQQEALVVLIKGIHLAQRQGAFTLDDAEVLARAVRAFVKKTDSPEGQQSLSGSEASTSRSDAKGKTKVVEIEDMD